MNPERFARIEQYALDNGLPSFDEFYSVKKSRIVELLKEMIAHYKMNRVTSSTVFNSQGKPKRTRVEGWATDAMIRDLEDMPLVEFARGCYESAVGEWHHNRKHGHKQDGIIADMVK